MDGGRKGGREAKRERASRVYLPATPHLYDALSPSLSHTHTLSLSQPPHIAVLSHVQHVHLIQPPAMNILTRERVREEKEVRECVRGGGLKVRGSGNREEVWSDAKHESLLKKQKLEV